MKRLLITGGSGYLGQHLVPLALEQHGPVCYTVFSSDPLLLPQARSLDIRDDRAVREVAADFQPDAIIHTAGSNRSPDMTHVIVQGTRNVVEVAKQNRARLIHLSSDVVFDGKEGPYAPGDRPNPIHQYGRAKTAAEEIVSEYPDHAIIRTSLIYGLDIMDRSTEWIVSSLRAGETVTLYEDQLRSPVWVQTLSLACLELVESSFCGIIHVAGAQAVTRSEFGLRLLAWWGIDPGPNLTIGKSDPAFPKDCRLDIAASRQILSTGLPGFDEVLGAHWEARRSSI